MKKFMKILVSGLITTSMLIGSISNVFAGQVVKVSIGSTTANVNGYDTTLSVAPYIQKSSGSMMIPLRFVSTALGIPEDNIIYNSNEKTITINYNGTNAKFLVGTDKVYINGQRFTMYVNDIYTSCTEIKNGNTFIPLRSLETLFGIKIDWINETKTAILTNEIENTTNNIQVEEQPTIEDNSSLIDNTKPIIDVEDTAVSSEKELTEEEIRAMEEEVVKLVNEERAKYGLQPLEISEKLMQTAREKSEDMATNNYFSHTDPNGYTMAMELNLAENIHAGSITPEGAVRNWLNSKLHRENILNPNYKYIGVGFYDNNNSDYQGYWTQHFSF